MKTHITSRSRFTSEQVVDAAFKLLREQGQDSVVARAVAHELGSSTMPIYSYIKSKEKLIQQLLDKAFEILTHYIFTKRTGDFWVDWGVGYVFFAIQEKNLFNLILREHKPSNDPEQKHYFWISLLEKASGYEPFKELSEAQVEMVMLRRFMFTLGLATHLSKASEGFLSETQIIEMVKGTSASLIEGAKSGVMSVV